MLQLSLSAKRAGVRVPEPVAARLGVSVAVLTLVPTVMVGDPVPVVGVRDGPEVAVGDAGPTTVRVPVGCPVTVAVPAGVAGVTVMVAVAVPAGVAGVTVMVAVAVPAGTVTVAVAPARVAVGVGVVGSPATRSARISPAWNIIV